MFFRTLEPLARTVVPPLADGTLSSSPAPGTPLVNGMSVDVEDYFHVSAFERTIDRADWDRFESRVCRNTDRLLEIFNQAGVTSTFFVLGWVAERFPTLVRRIAMEGHEIGSHGFDHRLVYELTPAQFRADIQRSRAVLECVTGQPVLGYRAPSFSITSRSMWAFDVLIEEGFLYDASVFPIHHDRYGIPDAPRHPHEVRRNAGTIWELPASTVRRAGANLPIAGGAYFRLLPYAWTRCGIRRVNIVERQPAIFYLHPWELDPEQPRVAAPLVSRLRHYGNLAATERRLQRLLREFAFAPLGALVDNAVQSASDQVFACDTLAASVFMAHSLQ